MGSPSKSDDTPANICEIIMSCKDCFYFNDIFLKSTARPGPGEPIGECLRYPVEKDIFYVGLCGEHPRVQAVMYNSCALEVRDLLSLDSVNLAKRDRG